jgi:hypothetical protein
MIFDILRLAAAVAFVSVLLPAPAHAVSITACGQVVPAGDTGVLQNDLDCSSEPPSWHIVLEKHAVLELAGHAIVASAGSDAIRCLGNRCTVHGPGDVSGGSIAISADRNVVAEHVTIHDVGYGIGGGPKGKLQLTDVHIARAGIHGVAGNTIVATDVSAVDCGSDGIHALGTLRATGITATGNGGAGVDTAKPYKIDGLVATGNGQVPNRGGAGLYAVHKGRLSNAVLTGNSYSRPQTGAFLVDIFVRHAPKVANVTCDHSLAWITTGEVGAPLGICTQD